MFGRLFGRSPPKLTLADARDFDKLIKFANWFLRNDPLVKPLNGPLCELLWNEGVRPVVANPLTNPELPARATGETIPDLPTWFILKIRLDLTTWLSDGTQAQFRDYLDRLDAQGVETLTRVGELARTHGLDLADFVYSREIAKLPDDDTRYDFKENYLTDTALAAETRVLAWLYHDYFNEWYQLPQ